MPWKMYLVVSFLHLDIPGLKKFGADPQVQEPFLRPMETPEDSQSGKD